MWQDGTPVVWSSWDNHGSNSGSKDCIYLKAYDTIKLGIYYCSVDAKRLCQIAGTPGEYCIETMAVCKYYDTVVT